MYLYIPNYYIDSPLTGGCKVRLQIPKGGKMLTIGEFSNICKLSIKTLRYYSEIGLLEPDQINAQTGYRYYSVNQLERVLYINRLKSYNFSLEDIKSIINSDDNNDYLIDELLAKQNDFERSIQEATARVKQLKSDIENLRKGKNIMSYMDDIDVTLTEVPKKNILYIKKKIHKEDMALEYQQCFNKLLTKIVSDSLTVLSKPMVMFHSDEFNEDGLETEFAIQVKECVTGTRDFEPKLCLKSTHKGAYSELASIYTKLLNYAEEEGYKINGTLFEIYITDPSQVEDENNLITEVYLPVKKLDNK